MGRHLGCRNVSEYRYVVERMDEHGEWTSKHYVSQRDITEELGITRTAIHYLVIDDRGSTRPAPSSRFGKAYTQGRSL